ncbi:MAG TPA: OmpA family protein [Burkholderiales bacterium]|jgi:chemotaxis protein MotB
MSKNRLLFVNGAVAAALAAGGCVSKGDYEKLQAERDGLQQKVNELESQRTGLESQQTNLRSEVVTLEKQRAQLEAQNRQNQAQYDSLARNLNEEVAKGQLQVRQYKDMMTVEVAEQVFFDSGKATLKDSGRDVLKKVGEALRGSDDKLIRVIGHTDNVPIGKSMLAQYPSNWELSAARASTVVRALEAAGVPPDRLAALGRGEYSPVASNDDPEGRRKNRRIEITVIDRNLATELQNNAK